MLLFFCTFISIEANTRTIEHIFFPSQSTEVDPALTVTQITAASISMSWSNFGANYKVTITDLTASRILTTFNSTNTNATVGGLISGHTYRCEVADGTPIINVDIVMG